MTVLSADTDIDRKEDFLTQYPVVASEVIYKGALVCLNASGYLIAAEDVAGQHGYRFAGIAYEKADNSAGSDGAKKCRVYTKGVFQLLCQAITQAHVGQLMYVRDDSMVDNTSTNWMCAGRLVKYVAGNSGWVDIGDRVGAADQAIYVPVNTRIYFKGTSNYIYANAADQLILVAANTINLTATTYVRSEGAFQVGGNLTMDNNQKVYLRGTTNYIWANAADQVIIVAANTIELQAVTYTSVTGKLNVTGVLQMASGQKLQLRGTTNYITANAADQVIIVAANTINLQPTGYIAADADIRMAAGKKICFYGTTEHIAGNAANQLILTATNTINLNATLYVACGIYLLLKDTHDDPPSPTDGMLWYDGVQDEFKGRKAGATVTLTTS